MYGCMHACMYVYIYAEKMMNALFKENAWKQNNVYYQATATKETTSETYEALATTFKEPYRNHIASLRHIKERYKTTFKARTNTEKRPTNHSRSSGHS